MRLAPFLAAILLAASLSACVAPVRRTGLPAPAPTPPSLSFDSEGAGDSAAGPALRIDLEDLFGPPSGPAPLRVAGKEVTAGQILGALRATHPDLVDRATDYVVEACAVLAECRRLGITVNRPEVEPYREMVAEEAGEGREGRAALRALSDRLVRYLAMREERVTVGLLRVSDRRRAEDLRRKLELGADLRRLARAESEDPSAGRGGILPPVPRSRPTALAAEAFKLREGEVSPVLAAREGDRTVFFVLKVLRRDPAVDAPYVEVARDLRAGLRLQPVTAEEHFYLSAYLAERYPVE